MAVLLPHQHLTRRSFAYLDPRLLAVGAAIIVVGLVRDFLGGLPNWTLVVLPSVAAAGFLYYRLRQINVTLYARGERMGLTNSLGIANDVPVADVAYLVMCSLSLPRREQPLPLLVAVSKSGRCLFRLSGADRMALSEIRRLAAAAGLELRGSWTDTLTLSGIESRYPGTVSRFGRLAAWVLVHQRLVSTVTIAATGFVFVALVLVTTRR